MEIFTQSAKETQEFGQKIANTLIQKRRSKQTTILALYGELGSGKTTFTQGLAKGLGLPHRLVSPTFIIVREYPLDLKNYQRLYHIDLYRIENPGQIADLGFAEIFSDQHNIVVIEWAERLDKKLPKKRIDIRFKEHDGGRLVKISRT